MAIPKKTDTPDLNDAWTQALLTRANRLSFAAAEFEGVQDRMTEATSAIAEMTFGSDVDPSFTEVRDGLVRRMAACGAAAAYLRGAIEARRDQIIEQAQR